MIPAPRILVVDRDAELAARLRQQVASSDGVVKRCAYEVRADREGSREYDDGPRGGYDRGGGSRGGYGGGSGYRRPADDDF